MTQLPVLVSGRNGRMARLFTEAACADPEIDLLGQLAPKPGADASLGVITNLTQASKSDPVILDFTHPDRTNWVLSQAEASPCSLVIGTSGLDEQVADRIQALTQHRAILLVANASTGIRVLSKALQYLAEVGNDGWDASILDIHFKGKADTVSGTANALARQWTCSDKPSTRNAKIASIRQGDGVSEHRILCHARGEVIEFVHRIEDRSAFLHPVLTAAKKLSGTTPGLYSIEDLI